MEIEDTQILKETFQRLLDTLKKFPGMNELYLDLTSLIRNFDAEITTNKGKTYELFEKHYRRFLAILKQPNNL